MCRRSVAPRVPSTSARMSSLWRSQASSSSIQANGSPPSAASARSSSGSPWSSASRRPRSQRSRCWCSPQLIVACAPESPSHQHSNSALRRPTTAHAGTAARTPRSTTTCSATISFPMLLRTCPTSSAATPASSPSATTKKHPTERASGTAVQAPTATSARATALAGSTPSRRSCCGSGWQRRSVARTHASPEASPADGRAGPSR